MSRAVCKPDAAVARHRARSSWSTKPGVASARSTRADLLATAEMLVLLEIATAIDVIKARGATI